jgi:hypothetical protein
MTQESVQWKFDTHVCLVESFKELLQTNEDEHIKIQTKDLSTIKAWNDELFKLKTMNQ